MSAFGRKAAMTSYNTFVNCGHRAPHGSFMLCAIFFGQSAVLDQFVLKVRQEYIKALRRLPPPKT
jgi:hypothetical protein